ncbi:response regulator transcription factor [Pontibacillus yanchengensis]|uniref:Chemotaxis protein CheY n=1 Tax=Pontibacillus yanchengensis Y32 TaxID=1385514 RepID=A0A0A2TCR1_9BACI|nr:response regulator transcription factor [Pontibacillus yanchengensis]KGP73314.1 chemotaxis protein CheY [Pontibacillus yanchengensis Y32]
MTSILYVEDDLEIGEWVKKELEAEGYLVHWYVSDEGVEQSILEADIAILDVMLPGIDGFTLGKRIKDKKENIPIMMLTARTAVDDKVYGLQFADDYVTKPFHPKELLARVDVLLRRFEHSPTDSIQIDYLTVFPKRYQIINENTGEEIILSGKQHKIFFYLVRHLNQILTKEQIYEGIWNEPYIEGDKTLMVHMRHLREKIEQNPSKPAIIQTIRGIGYRVKA